MSCFRLSCMTMFLSDSIKPVIQICQFAGLFPISTSRNKTKWQPNSFLKFLSIIYIIVAVLILLTITTFPHLFLYYDKHSEVSLVLWFCLLLFNHLHAMFALIELFLKRNHQANLLNLFESIDNILKEHLNDHINYGKLKSKCFQIVFLWFWEMAGFVICDMISYIRTKNNNQLRYLSIFLPFYILGRLSYAYAILLVILTHECLDVMNTHLKSINKQNGYYICERFIDQKCLKYAKWNSLMRSRIQLNTHTLHLMKLIYCEIWKTNYAIKYLNTWSLHFGIWNEFFVLLFSLYWFVSSLFLTSWTFVSYLVWSSLVIPNIINILFICHHYSKVVNSVSK